MEIDERPQVATAAKLMNLFLYNNKNNLMAGMIIAGYDAVPPPYARTHTHTQMHTHTHTPTHTHTHTHTAIRHLAHDADFRTVGGAFHFTNRWSGFRSTAGPCTVCPLAAVSFARASPSEASTAARCGASGSADEASHRIASHRIASHSFHFSACSPQEHIFTTGSGSGYIYGFCDSHYKPRMSKAEAIEFVRNGTPSGRYSTVATAAHCSARARLRTNCGGSDARYQ